MTDSSLQDRLRDHAKAFDGLLSLIPAKMYYGEDTSDQWNRKKQTKAEAKAARMGKLDPGSDLNRNAKEVMEERAKNKRKLQDMEEAERAALPEPPAQEQEQAQEQAQSQQDKDDNDSEPVPGVVQEAPGEGLRRRDLIANKKLKIDRDFEQDTLANVNDANPAEMTQDQLMRAAKRDGQKADRKAKQARQAEKRAKKLAAKEAAAAAKKAEKAAAADEEGQPAKKASEPKKQQKTAKGKAKDVPEATPSGGGDDDKTNDDGYETVDSDHDDEAAPAAAASLEDKPVVDSTASSQRSASQSPVFDAEATAEASAASAATSTNSTVAPSDKPKQLKIPQDTSALKARLAARIAELQAARKAIGPDGKPIRTRQELIEAQRARQAQRKAHKQEQRRQARLEEERQRDEALASNSPSIMSPALDHLLGDGADEPTDYTFGRVAFDDGTRLSRDLTHVLSSRKKKGPSDPKTALLRLQNQKKKQAALDDAKREDIAEKETWLTARRRAEGDKVRDDEATLKKAVRRKDKQKRKSEKEWKERTEGVVHAKAERQKKRDANLKKRKEDKKLGKAGRKVVAAAGKKKSRPGFEGSAGFGGKKKK